MENFQQIVEIFNKGGIVIFPTDTAYGIGCRIDIKESVNRLFRIRERPSNMAVPVLAGSIPMAQNYWQKPVNKKIQKLITKYWPGALTVIYFADIAKVDRRITGGSCTLGLRIPDYKDLLALINAVGVPIIGTSANFHKGKTPFTYEDLDPHLVKLVDYTIKGELKKDGVSTIVDCTKDKFSIIRQGVLSISKDNL